jgi:hypothetical protein
MQMLGVASGRYTSCLRTCTGRWRGASRWLSPGRASGRVMTQGAALLGELGDVAAGPELFQFGAESVH